MSRGLENVGKAFDAAMKEANSSIEELYGAELARLLRSPWRARRDAEKTVAP